MADVLTTACAFLSRSQAAGPWSTTACCATGGNSCNGNPNAYTSCTDQNAASDFLFHLQPGETQRFVPTGTGNHVAEYQTVAPHSWPIWGGDNDLRMGGNGPLGTGGRCNQGATYAGSPNEACGGNSDWGLTEMETWYPVALTRYPQPAEPRSTVRVKTDDHYVKVQPDNESGLQLLGTEDQSKTTGSCPSGYCSDDYSCLFGCDCRCCRAGNYCAGSTDALCEEGIIASGKQRPCSCGTYSSSCAPSCQSCGSGQYSNGGSSSCSSCSSGTTSSSGSCSCNDCSCGRHEVSNTRCDSCLAGQYSSSRSTVCSRCGTGHVSSSGACSCRACFAGQTSNNEHTSCVDCPAGHFSHQGSDCESCDSGQYQPAPRSSSCIACTSGSVAVSASSGCTGCTPGRASNVGLSSCDDCSMLTYQPASHSSHCLACPIGRANFEKTRATSCFDCGPGRYRQHPVECSTCSFEDTLTSENVFYMTSALICTLAVSATAVSAVGWKTGKLVHDEFPAILIIIAVSMAPLCIILLAFWVACDDHTLEPSFAVTMCIYGMLGVVGNTWIERGQGLNKSIGSVIAKAAKLQTSDYSLMSGWWTPHKTAKRVSVALMATSAAIVVFASLQIHVVFTLDRGFISDFGERAHNSSCLAVCDDTEVWFFGSLALTFAVLTLCQHVCLVDGLQTTRMVITGWVSFICAACMASCLALGATQEPAFAVSLCFTAAVQTAWSIVLIYRTGDGLTASCIAVGSVSLGMLIFALIELVTVFKYDLSLLVGPNAVCSSFNVPAVSCGSVELRSYGILGLVGGMVAVAGITSPMFKGHLGENVPVQGMASKDAIAAMAVGAAVSVLPLCIICLSFWASCLTLDRNQEAAFAVVLCVYGILAVAASAWVFSRFAPDGGALLVVHVWDQAFCVGSGVTGVAVWVFASVLITAVYTHDSTLIGGPGHNSTALAPRPACCTTSEVYVYGIAAGVGALATGVASYIFHQGKQSAVAFIPALGPFTLICITFWGSCLAEGETQEAAFSIMLCLYGICGVLVFGYAAIKQEFAGVVVNRAFSVSIGALSLLVLVFASIETSAVHHYDTTLICGSPRECQNDAAHPQLKAESFVAPVIVVIFLGVASKLIIDMHNFVPVVDIGHTPLLHGAAAPLYIDSEETSFSIDIKTLTGRTFSPTVSSLDSIAMLKAKVQSLSGTPTDEQRILFASQVLADGAMVADYPNIVAGAVLHLVLKLASNPADLLTIRVRMRVDGRYETVCTVHLPRTDVVLALKLGIQAECDAISVEQQQLSFASEPLDDSFSLQASGVSNNDTVELTVAELAGAGGRPITLATSNYLREYRAAGRDLIVETDALIDEVRQLLSLYCAANGVHTKHGATLADKLGQQANSKPGGPRERAMLMWTSESFMRGGVNKRLYDTLNDVFRHDDAGMIRHAVRISRCINELCVGGDMPPAAATDLMRESGNPRKEVYRGTGFDSAHRGFFVEGKTYRVPMYIATTTSRQVAQAFISRANTGDSHVMWLIIMDATSPMYNASLVKKNTLIPGEEEFLFVPYSVFTIDKATWKRGTKNQPHEIVLMASSDNTGEREDLELAPWA